MFRPRNGIFRPRKINSRPWKINSRPRKITFRPRKIIPRPRKKVFRPRKVVLRPRKVPFRPRKDVFRPRKMIFRVGATAVSAGKPPPQRCRRQLKAVELKKRPPRLAVESRRFQTLVVGTVRRAVPVAERSVRRRNRGPKRESHHIRSARFTGGDAAAQRPYQASGL